MSCVSAGEPCRARSSYMETYARETWGPSVHLYPFVKHDSKLPKECLLPKRSTLLTRAQLSSQEHPHPDCLGCAAGLPIKIDPWLSLGASPDDARGCRVNILISPKSPWRPVLSTLPELCTLYIPTRFSEPANGLNTGCQDQNLICG